MVVVVVAVVVRRLLSLAPVRACSRCGGGTYRQTDRKIGRLVNKQAILSRCIRSSDALEVQAREAAPAAAAATLKTVLPQRARDEETLTD